jgi:bisphosphoglycerate-independent phosphoglycerate mutase (AlkP superfamily)
MFKYGRLKKFVTLIILDGWGIADKDENNLISATPTPQFNKLVEMYPSTVLVNPIDASTLKKPSEDACRLSHYLIGTSKIENSLSALEKEDPLSVNSLSRILSKNNLKQLYLTDAEKFPQLTFFYRGCYSKLLENEKQILVKGDNKQNSIKNIFKELNKQLDTRKFNFVVINLSNIDVSAHSGNRKDTIRGIKLVDKYLGEITKKILSWEGDILITADHGKGEKFSSSKEEKKAHTKNKVPFIFVSNKSEGQSFPRVKLIGSDLSHLKPSGFLTDIAPTVLKILKIKKPSEMMGKSLI